MSYANRTQYPNKVNLWTGIINQQFVSPNAIEGTLTAEGYLNLLQNKIGERVAYRGLGD